MVEAGSIRTVSELNQYPISLSQVYLTIANVMHLRSENVKSPSPAPSPQVKQSASPKKRTRKAMKIEEQDEPEDEEEEPVTKRARKTSGSTPKKRAPKLSENLKPKGGAKVQSNGVPSVSKVNDVESEPEAKKAKKAAKDMKVAHQSTSKASAKKTKTSSSKVKLEKIETSSNTKRASPARTSPRTSPVPEPVPAEEPTTDVDEEVKESEEDEKPEVAAKAREKVQSTLKSSGKDPYPDWKPGEPVPYAALCTTYSLIEMTTKRLIILAHCSLFLRQVLRLTPNDLLPTIQLMINKLAAEYAGIELGIGESLIMKAIGESTGRSLAIIKADQNEIGDLGLVAAKSRSNQPTMFKPKALTVRGVHEGLMAIAVVEGNGAQARKVGGIKKLLSAADANLAGKGGKGVDITKDKGGPSEAKFIVRTLEGKLRLGLAEKTILVALAQAMVIHEISKKGSKVPSTEQLAQGESILKTVYR